MSYALDTPYSNQVIFLNSQNSIYKSIDGQGQYNYSFQTPIQLPINCEMLTSVTDAQLPNILYIKWNLVVGGWWLVVGGWWLVVRGSWFVVVVFYVPTVLTF